MDRILQLEYDSIKPQFSFEEFRQAVYAILPSAKDVRHISQIMDEFDVDLSVAFGVYSLMR
jgi:hypothetical protein